MHGTYFHEYLSVNVTTRMHKRILHIIFEGVYVTAFTLFSTCMCTRVFVCACVRVSMCVSVCVSECVQVCTCVRASRSFLKMLPMSALKFKVHPLFA